MFHVSYSVSMNTGIPPSYTMGLTVASNVISLDATRRLHNAPVPGDGFPYIFSPASFIAKCNAAVPADSATAYLHPTFSQMLFSASLMFAPTVDIQLVS